MLFVEPHNMKSVLLNYSKSMNQDYKHSYHYDNEAKLNIITDANGLSMPFVNSNFDKLCITTKTEAFREADDTVNEMLLISTKTREQMESDDTSIVINK